MEYFRTSNKKWFDQMIDWFWIIIFNLKNIISLSLIVLALQQFKNHQVNNNVGDEVEEMKKFWPLISPNFPLIWKVLIVKRSFEIISLYYFVYFHIYILPMIIFQPGFHVCSIKHGKKKIVIQVRENNFYFNRHLVELKQSIPLVIYLR